MPTGDLNTEDTTVHTTRFYSLNLNMHKMAQEVKMTVHSLVHFNHKQKYK